MKLVIVGGVAGGASCAARARRLSEDAEIIMFERGPYVSFANCGLPYHIGDVIKEESSLLVVTPEFFKERFRIDVRTNSEVLSIDRKAQTVQVKDLKTGMVYSQSYDALTLSPGAQPIKPPLPGIDLPGIFSLRTIPDTRKIKNWISEKKSKSAVIIGGGFIGLEMAENLVRLGLKVSILEMQPQALPPFDYEMLPPVHEHLKSKNVSCHLGDALKGFETQDGSLIVNSSSGLKIKTDLVILSIGVRPESSLAKDSGLALGERGGIAVDEHMQTSDPHIWAVGDAVESKDYVLKIPTAVPLAGPANRQGRVAADNIFGRKTKYRGIQGTAVCKVFDYVCALTGTSEKTLRRLNIPYEKVYLNSYQHATYYPGARNLDLKLLFSPEDGRILGAQAVGEEGAEKRIDVISMAIQMKATVYDLEEAELSYAPQFGSAKDPVNVIGMIAANALRGDAPLAHWDKIDFEHDYLLDVRTKEEFAQGNVRRSVNIPINSLREKTDLLPRNENIYVYCGVGQRAYNATRQLRLKGFNAFNISGGFFIYRQMVNPKK